MTILNKKQTEVLDFGLAAKVRGFFCFLKMIRKLGNTLVSEDGVMMGTGEEEDGEKCTGEDGGGYTGTEMSHFLIIDGDTT